MNNLQIAMLSTAALAVGCTAMFLFDKRIRWYFIGSVFWTLLILLTFNNGLPP